MTATSSRLSVVVPRLQDHDVVGVDEVDQPVFFVYASGPGAREGVPEGLGLADTDEGISASLLDQPVDPFQDRPIGHLPEDVVLPPVRCEDEPHVSSSCS